MFCGNCGCEIDHIVDGKCPNCSAPIEFEGQQILAQENKSTEKKEQKFSFIDEDEQKIAQIGTSYMQSYITSSTIGKTSAVLTNKRAYLSGMCYEKSSGHYVKDEKEAVCELEDIVMTGIVRTQRVFLLWLGIILLGLGIFGLGRVAGSSYQYRLYNDGLCQIMWFGGIALMIVSIVMLIIYFVTQGVWYEVSTAGCTFGINISKLGGYDNVKIFDRKLHRQKEARINRLNNQGTDSTK